MYTLADMVKALSRPAVVISRLQDRFELPAFEGEGYSAAYLAFLRSVVYRKRVRPEIGTGAVGVVGRSPREMLKS